MEKMEKPIALRAGQPCLVPTLFCPIIQIPLRIPGHTNGIIFIILYGVELFQALFIFLIKQSHIDTPLSDFLLTSQYYLIINCPFLQVP